MHQAIVPTIGSTEDPNSAGQRTGQAAPAQLANLRAGHLEQTLKGSIRGDVRFDRLSRAIYATDASIYEIVPLGVVLPRDAADVVATVHACREAGVPIVARGAGTGLAGGAVGPGLQLDLSRYMNAIRDFDPVARTVVVEPGVVLDELNTLLAPHGLYFAPDVATSSRATLGGMMANNSCGARSVFYGRTVDHVQELTVVLSDGEIVHIARPTNGRARELAAGLGAIRDRYGEEIAARFPRIMRSNGGYGLDRLGPPGTEVDPIKVVCGSEGTLGIIVSAKLNLVPLPAHTGLAVLHFPSIAAALTATPHVLEHRPSAVELIDRMIIDAGRQNPAIGRGVGFLVGDPEALLVVEFMGGTADEVGQQLDLLLRDTRISPTAAPLLRDKSSQSSMWNLRTAGLGLLMSRPGDAQPHSFVEDTAVPPQRLGEYIERFGGILAREGVSAGYYAHASVGCIHVKPVLNLKTDEGLAKLRRIAEAVTDLAVEFGGTITCEHGDGIVRSCWLERMYGPRIMQAFREVKTLFDPHGLMNPNKIVDPLPMTDHLRHGPSFQHRQEKTYFDYSEHGGIAGLVGMCSGVGQCRQRLVGTMCPSYIATGDETHTTRARANALRLALSNRGLLSGLDDPALVEVMDLCIACKACKTECPTGVDMARVKAEFLARRILLHGASRRARFIAEMPRKLAWAAKLPRVFNRIARSNLARDWVQRRFGLDARIPPPALARQTFRRWFSRRQPTAAGPRRGTVAFLADTWTNYFTPQVGMAAVRLLECAGYRVICPPTVCCGRPAISQGLLAEARVAAERNIQLLAPAAAAGIPILGAEPSCISALLDEYPRLLQTPAAKMVAGHTMLVETFLRQAWQDRPELIPKTGNATSPTLKNAKAAASVAHGILYHGHCHQKALLGTADAMHLLRLVYGQEACEIDSGCCGMAGAFGHEREHYELARAIGEHRLFPTIRNHPHAAVAVAGFSCRQQIAHHTPTAPAHLLELLCEPLLS